MSQRIVIETPCPTKHRYTDGFEDCMMSRPDSRCKGMTRTVLVLDEMVEKGARALHTFDYDPPAVVTSEIARVVLVAALGLEEQQ